LSDWTDAEPAIPDSTSTGASSARWLAIADMMAAVVLWSGG